MRRKYDWLALWVDYKKITGKRPSLAGDKVSRDIYRNVYQGARNGREGYSEFFEANRRNKKRTT